MMEGYENEPFKTTLHIKGGDEEFNLRAILDLLKKNNLKVASLGAENVKKGAEGRITDDNIPIEHAYLQVDASREEVEKVLQNSEFKDKIDELFGHGLN